MPVSLLGVPKWFNDVDQCCPDLWRNVVRVIATKEREHGVSPMREGGENSGEERMRPDLLKVGARLDERDDTWSSSSSFRV
jgi:hypothetical protein